MGHQLAYRSWFDQYREIREDRATRARSSTNDDYAARATAILAALRWTLPTRVSVKADVAQTLIVQIRIVEPDVTHWIVRDKSPALLRSAISPSQAGLLLRRYHFAAAALSAAKLFANDPRLTAVRVHGALQLSAGGPEHAISRAIVRRDLMAGDAQAMEELQRGAAVDVS